MSTETVNTFSDNLTINQCHIRGYWKWNVHNCTCAICRNYIFEPSINATTNDSCAVVGQCGHAYHFDCISILIKLYHPLLLKLYFNLIIYCICFLFSYCDDATTIGFLFLSNCLFSFCF